MRTLLSIVSVAPVALLALFRLVLFSEHRRAVQPLAVALIDRAARGLPRNERERWREEWLAEAEALRHEPLESIKFACSVAWYSPLLRRQLGRNGPGDPEAAALAKLARKYELKRQLARMVVLTPMAMVVAWLGGLLLNAVDAAPIWYHVFVVGLGAGTVMQILLRGTGLPRPWFRSAMDESAGRDASRLQLTG